MERILADLEKTLTVYFVNKVPALPKPIKSFLVSAMPILIIIDIVLLIFTLISIVGMGLFGASRMMMVAIYRPHFGFSLLIGGVVTLVSLVFLVKAYPLVSKRKYSGWQLLYYLTLIYLLGQLVLLDIVGFIISGLVGFYLLFQIKEDYK